MWNDKIFIIQIIRIVLCDEFKSQNVLSTDFKLSVNLYTYNIYKCSSTRHEFLVLEILEPMLSSSRDLISMRVE